MQKMCGRTHIAHAKSLTAGFQGPQALGVFLCSLVPSEALFLSILIQNGIKKKTVD